LNCYTKLKDVKKLDEFIKTDTELNFEVETAIKVLRQAGYHEHALYLAKRQYQHDWYLRIQIEDIQNYEDALEYISTLDFFEAEKNLKNYGKSLVSHLPEKTTQLLMKLCTDYTPKPTIRKPTSMPSDTTLETPFVASQKNSNASQVEKSHTKKVKGKPEEFIHTYVDQPGWLTKFLECMVEEQNSSPLVYSTLLELYLRDEDDMSGVKITEQEKKNRQEKALNLLRDPQAKYDVDHALVLVQIRNFQAGMLCLYEKLRLYQEIVMFYMENNDYEKVIHSCKTYGDSDPNLWVQVLSYFSAKEGDCQKELSEVLSNIETKNLLPPLQVIQILSQKPNVTLTVIKDYITHALQSEQQNISEDQRLIKQYAEETEKMRGEIQELKTNAKIFQHMKCSKCSNPLDLPAIHFLCMHSFHQRCLNEEHECPQCADSNRRVIEMKRSLEQNADQHEQFFKMLENSADGFATVSEYFGRGIFSKPITL